MATKIDEQLRQFILADGAITPFTFMGYRRNGENTAVHARVAEALDHPQLREPALAFVHGLPKGVPPQLSSIVSRVLDNLGTDRDPLVLVPLDTPPKTFAVQPARIVSDISSSRPLDPSNSGALVAYKTAITSGQSQYVVTQSAPREYELFLRKRTEDHPAVVFRDMQSDGVFHGLSHALHRAFDYVSLFPQEEKNEQIHLAVDAINYGLLQHVTGVSMWGEITYKGKKLNGKAQSILHVQAGLSALIHAVGLNFPDVVPEFEVAKHAIAQMTGFAHVREVGSAPSQDELMTVWDQGYQALVSLEEEHPRYAETFLKIQCDIDIAQASLQDGVWYFQPHEIWRHMKGVRSLRLERDDRYFALVRVNDVFNELRLQALQGRLLPYDNFLGNTYSPLEREVGLRRTLKQARADGFGQTADYLEGFLKVAEGSGDPDLLSKTSVDHLLQVREEAQRASVRFALLYAADMTAESNYLSSSDAEYERRMDHVRSMLHGVSRMMEAIDFDETDETTGEKKRVLFGNDEKRGLMSLMDEARVQWPHITDCDVRRYPGILFDLYRAERTLEQRNHEAHKVLGAARRHLRTTHGIAQILRRNGRVPPERRPAISHA